jgi:hypothetical protein
MAEDAKVPEWLVCHDLEGNQYVQHMTKPQFLAKFTIDDNKVGKLFDFAWLGGDSWPEDNQEFHEILDIASRFVGEYNQVTAKTMRDLIAQLDDDGTF